LFFFFFFFFFYGQMRGAHAYMCHDHPPLWCLR
jgi:hypothetical protein